MAELSIPREDGTPFATIEIADPSEAETEAKLHEINLRVLLIRLPSLLGRFRPLQPMGPEERFDYVVRAACSALGYLDPEDVKRAFTEVNEPNGYLFSQVYRASHDKLCDLCGKTYQQHPFQDGLIDLDDRPYIHRTCNGDLVKL
jgi:hypothetical protein